MEKKGVRASQHPRPGAGEALTSS